MEIRIGGQPLTVEIAADPDSRTAGLKGRESMPENHGMLFAFPASEKVGFYMKQLGCQIKKSKGPDGGKASTAVLTLPLAFPKQSRGPPQKR